MWYRHTFKNAPSPRCAHQAEVVEGRLYVFGGWTENQMLGDMHIYDVEKGGWVASEEAQQQVGARAGHSMTAVGMNLYVFGGSCTNAAAVAAAGANVLYNDMHIFDTVTGKWISDVTISGPTPPPRSKHTACLVGEKDIFVFGGGDATKLYDDLHIFNTETCTWSVAETSGRGPSARWGHTCVAAGKYLVVWGGHGGEGGLQRGKRLSDLHVLDLEKMEWLAHGPGWGGEGVVPHSRAGHTMNFVADLKILFLIGGGDGRVLPDMHALDPRTWSWSPVQCGPAPPRCAHTCNSARASNGAMLLLCWGGGDGIATFNDMFIYQVPQLSHSNNNMSLRAPVPLRPQPNQSPKHPYHAQLIQQHLQLQQQKQQQQMMLAQLQAQSQTQSHNTQDVQAQSDILQQQQEAQSQSSQAQQPATAGAAAATAQTQSTLSQAQRAVAVGNVPVLPATLVAAAAAAVVTSQSAAYNHLNVLNKATPPSPSRRGSTGQTPPQSPRDERPRRGSHGPSTLPTANNGGRSSPSPASSPRTTPPQSPRRQRDTTNAASTGAPSQIGSAAPWLTSLGLGKYIAAFEREEITMDVVHMLTETHLKLMLGVGPLKDRLTLLGAIAKHKSGLESQ